MSIENSTREKYRSDFNTEFLEDFVSQCAEHGKDIRNHIGLSCGVNNTRVLQIWHDRVQEPKELPTLLRRQAE